MLDYLKNRCKDFASDIYQWGSCLANVVLVGCMAYFYLDSGKRLEPLLFLIFFFFHIIVVFFFGRKSLPILYMVFSAGAVQDISFMNCTIFLVLIIATHCYPKMRAPVFTVYVLEIFFVCFRHGKSVWHLLAHFSMCVVFWLGYRLAVEYTKRKSFEKLSKEEGLFLSEDERIVIESLTKEADEEKKISQVEPPDLNYDEKLIVDKLAEGFLMKEIDGYSKNTKTKYLKSAMKRNGCSTKEELIARYAIGKNLQT